MRADSQRERHDEGTSGPWVVVGLRGAVVPALYPVARFIQMVPSGRSTRRMARATSTRWATYPISVRSAPRHTSSAGAVTSGRSKRGR